MLRLAVERGTTSPEDLARSLDTSPELVRMALAELVRRDYLQAVVPDHSTVCKHCPTRVVCLYRGHPGVWTLTRKGEAWLA